MKILITHYSICDYGGLVNDTEIMTYGFKSMGHEVSNIMLTPKPYGMKKGKFTEPRSHGYELGIGTGLYMHHKSGWLGMDAFGFLDSSKLKDWKKFANQFDLIIHQNPVPTKRKEYAGNSNWLHLYRVKPKQIVISPDANFRDSYPHLYEIRKYIDGVANTHEAGYIACEELPIPRVLLPGPHIVKQKEVNKNCKSKRQKGFISVQNFKPIKHVDDLVRAIPLMNKGTKKLLAGGGIEYHYMTSKDKVKPKYLDHEGNKIWDNAIDSGMNFLGYIDNATRDTIMRKNLLFIDCSWSAKYTNHGPHFNRTFIEAMMNGCVPVCTDRGMGGSDVFEAGKHYIEIPAVCTDKERADAIEAALKNTKLLDKIRETNRKYVKWFDHIRICENLILLGTDLYNCEGLLGAFQKGEATAELKRNSKKFMEFFK